MSEFEDLKQRRTLMIMSEKMVTLMGGKLQDPITFVISWLKNRDRLQILLNSKIKNHELTTNSKCLDSDLICYVQKGLLKKIGQHEYVLTIKGMLIGMNILNSNKYDEERLMDLFIDKFFDDQIKNIIKEKNKLDSTEKTWLLSMIILNCFSANSSIDVLNNARNKKNYVILYNKIGEFMLAEGYYERFDAIEADEFLRRELENINKKIFDIAFSKERKCFYINISTSSNKQEILDNLLRKIYDKNAGINKAQLERIRSFFIYCQSFFYKIERNGKDVIEWDKEIDNALTHALLSH